MIWLLGIQNLHVLNSIILLIYYTSIYGTKYSKYKTKCFLKSCTTILRSTASGWGDNYWLYRTNFQAHLNDPIRQKTPQSYKDIKWKTIQSCYTESEIACFLFVYIFVYFGWKTEILLLMVWVKSSDFLLLFEV